MQYSAKMLPKENLKHLCVKYTLVKQFRSDVSESFSRIETATLLTVIFMYKDFTKRLRKTT